MVTAIETLREDNVLKNFPIKELRLLSQHMEITMSLRK